MHTARSLTVSPSMHCSGGVPAPGGGGGGMIACTEADPLPPVNRMKDRCKNITLPQTSFAGDKYGPHVGNNSFRNTFPKTIADPGTR